MIHLTRLNHEDVLVNPDLIVLVEANPDTVISLTTGERVRVLETLQELTQRVVDFKRLVLDGTKLVGGSAGHG
jgi:flagellar protein FlbD